MSEVNVYLNKIITGTITLRLKENFIYNDKQIDFL